MLAEDVASIEAMARATYWERSHARTIPAQQNVKGTRQIAAFSSSNTLTRTLWHCALTSETEEVPAPLLPKQVTVGIYNRPADSGLVLYPLDHEDAANWISRRTVTMTPFWYTQEETAILLAVQRGGDTGPVEVQSRGQRTTPGAITELVFSYQVDERSETLNQRVWYDMTASFLILI